LKEGAQFLKILQWWA